MIARGTKPRGVSKLASTKLSFDSPFAQLSAGAFKFISGADNHPDGQVFTQLECQVRRARAKDGADGESRTRTGLLSPADSRI